MEKGGFYEESPKDPITGRMMNFRVTTHSSSKLFNDANGAGTVAAHKDTIAFLGDMLRGSFTQAHQRDRRTIPAIVENIDFDAPRRWMTAMNDFDKIVEGNVPGFQDLGSDSPPFKCYDASAWLQKHDLNPADAQHYFMSRSPGLCGIFGGFGPGQPTLYSSSHVSVNVRRLIPLSYFLLLHRWTVYRWAIGSGSNEIFRLGFTGEAPERAPLCARKFVEYANDEEAIKKFKAREDTLTTNFLTALEEIQAREA